MNLNIENSVHLANFLRVAVTVHKNLVEKYGESGFSDPAKVDPYAVSTDTNWDALASKFEKATKTSS